MAMDFVAGCLGGCAGVAVGHPFDTVKVRLQTQDFLNPKYRGTWHCFSDTIKKESVRGLYKGMSSPMAGVAVVNAIVFGVQGNMARYMKNPDSLRSQTLAGATAGFFQAFVTSPMELVKTRVQLQTEAAATPTASLSTASSSSSTITASRSYDSPLDCLRKIYTTEGFKGLFRGQLITLVRDVPALSTYFFTYEYLAQKWSSDGYVSAPVVLGAGGMAGIASWVLTYPIDVVKSRLQADGVGGINKYNGVIDCIRASVAQEGLSVLSRGLLSTIIRAFPVNATTFAVVTWTQRLFHKEGEDDLHSDTWKEVLAVGENLVEAAKVPIPAFLNLKAPATIRTFTPLLPQVRLSCSCENLSCKTNISSAIKNRLPEILLCSESARMSDSQCQNAAWMRTSDQILSSCSSLSALTRRQHNLSNAL
ncbi:mitochondrial basic amino acids transporter-like [Macrobrachium nipponense]|uniref:mitochondrial basic amino acids transporter-like n=1 Tax=Macrobrachium nipponense TaxID=159736 RepID=UPI0030C8BF1B